jgi:hypothetical protein
VVVAWKGGPHLLTYRQTERTFSLVVEALERREPNGTPSDVLADVIDAMVEASVPDRFKNATRAVAVDWSDMESFARGPLVAGGDTANTEASWGHRRGHGPGQKDESFFGYFLQAATMVREEDGPPVPELARRIGVTSCDHDPPQAFVPVLERMATSGVVIGDVLTDSGYATGGPNTGPCRCGGWGRHWCKISIPMTGDPRARISAPPSPTATSTVRPRLRRCWPWGPSPVTPTPTRRTTTTP